MANHPDKTQATLQHLRHLRTLRPAKRFLLPGRVLAAMTSLITKFGGGPRLAKGHPIHAKPGAPQFFNEYHEAHASLRKPRRGTLMTIIAEYKASAEFKNPCPVKPAFVPHVH